jgi:hypothetical protein
MYRKVWIQIIRWKLLWSRGDYFQFGSVFIKKNNQTDFFLKKPKLVQTDQFWFSFLGQKPV